MREANRLEKVSLNLRLTASEKQNKETNCQKLSIQLQRYKSTRLVKARQDVAMYYSQWHNMY
jgi:hypothetical protein